MSSQALAVSHVQGFAPSVQQGGSRKPEGTPRLTVVWVQHRPGWEAALRLCGPAVAWTAQGHPGPALRTQEEPPSLATKTEAWGPDSGRGTQSGSSKSQATAVRLAVTLTVPEPLSGTW